MFFEKFNPLEKLCVSSDIYVCICIYVCVCVCVCVYISNQYENQCSTPHYGSCSLFEKDEQVFNFNKTIYAKSLQSCAIVCNQDCSHQASLSMEFSRQKYWSGLPRPPPRDLLTQGLNPHLLWLVHCRQILYR